MTRYLEGWTGTLVEHSGAGQETTPEDVYYLSLTNSLSDVNNVIFLLSSLCGLNFDYDLIESWKSYYSPLKTTNVLQYGFCLFSFSFTLDFD